MAAATLGGSISEPGSGGVAGCGGGEHWGDISSSSGDGGSGIQALSRGRACSPKTSAAAALARAVVASPAKTSHVWASSFGGI